MVITFVSAGFVICITPLKAQTTLELFVKTGPNEVIIAAEPGIQLPETKGVQGGGILVALKMGFSGDKQIPIGGMFTNGILSLTVNIGPSLPAIVFCIIGVKSAGKTEKVQRH